MRNSDLDHAFLAEAERQRAFLHRGMGVLGAVDPQRREIATGDALGADVQPQGLARRREREKDVDRRRVVDDAEEVRRQAEGVAQPAQGERFELGQCRRRLPEHAIRVERGAEQLAEDAGLRAGDAEVGEKAGVIPVRDAGEDLLLELAQQLVIRLAAVRRTIVELPLHIARLHAREHGKGVDVLEIVGDPVDGFVRGFAERSRGGVELRHGAEV
jgi:hypothetical protein